MVVKLTPGGEFISNPFMDNLPDHAFLLANVPSVVSVRLKSSVLSRNFSDRSLNRRSYSELLASYED